MMREKPTPTQEAIAVSISVLAFFGGLAYGVRCVIWSAGLIVKYIGGFL
jgi:hypothetical protein